MTDAQKKYDEIVEAVFKTCPEGFVFKNSEGRVYIVVEKKKENVFKCFVSDCFTRDGFVDVSIDELRTFELIDFKITISEILRTMCLKYQGNVGPIAIQADGHFICSRDGSFYDENSN